MSETNTADVSLGKVTPSILMPLPDHDFDPTESAIPWKVCASQGWRVVFSTEHGEIAQADAHKLKGPLPGLLSASMKARAAYQEMTQDPFFRQPIPYAEIDPDCNQALLLPGGDALRMRQYLESPVLQGKVLRFWQRGKLVGAICHGVLVLARTTDPQTGHSVLYGRKVTVLPKSLDRAAYLLDRWLLKRGYLYDPCSVEEQVRACLERPKDLAGGPSILVPYAVSDGNLVTARWYGDAERFAERFAGELQQRMRGENRTT